MAKTDLNTTKASADIDTAVKHHQAGRLEEAKRLYEQVLESEPGHATAMCNLGVIARQQGRCGDAVELIGKAIQVAPRTARFHNVLGVVLNTGGEFEQAVNAFRQAVELSPGYGDARYNMGNSLVSLGRYDDAIEQYGQALQVGSDDGWIRYNMAVAMQKASRHTEAISAFEAVVRLGHDPAEAYKGMASSQQMLGRYDDAICSLRRAVDLQPDCVRTHCDLGAVLLQMGQFEEGWREYGWRLCGYSGWDECYKNLPRWDGSDFTGKRLLVLCEQGLGDNIQFVRYLPMVKARGGTVILAVYSALGPLLKGFDGVDEIVEARFGEDVSVEFDICSPILDMPRIFGTTVDTIPADIPYIHADREKSAYWKERLSGARLKVGIVWGTRFRSGETDGNRACRPGHFLKMNSIEGVRLYSLEKGPGVVQLKEVYSEIEIPDLGREFEDFSDTAAAIDNLDLVVSVDTSVLHLAGAMGKPVWGLLRFEGNWRWLLEREDSPWYPTMRLFRQEKSGDWEGVFACVEEQLRRLVKFVV